MYSADHSLRDEIVKFFIAWGKAKTIFEFGCNGGKNLAKIKQVFPSVGLFGIDLNEKAVKYCKDHFKIDIEQGDETYLPKIPDKSFDFCLTSSVLNHLPEDTTEYVLNQLKRITKDGILSVESNNLPGTYVFKHDYRKYNLKIIKSRWNDKMDALYDFYVWHPMQDNPKEWILNDPIL